MKSTWHIKIILSNLIYLPSLQCSIFNHLLLYFIIINLSVIYLSSASIIYHLFIYQSYLPNYPLSSYLAICALLSLLLYIYMLYYVKYVPCIDQQIVRKRGRWERCSSSFGITLTQFFWLWNISVIQKDILIQQIHMYLPSSLRSRTIQGQLKSPSYSFIIYVPFFPLSFLHPRSNHQPDWVITTPVQVFILYCHVLIHQQLTVLFYKLLKFRQMIHCMYRSAICFQRLVLYF